MLDLQYLIEHYGYLALFIGTFLEGETILVLGGIAAQQGWLELPWVITVAFVGSLAGDQLAFLIGRRWGRAILARFPSWQAKVTRIQARMNRYLDLWMLTFRFFYGLRNPTPFVLATCGVPLARFSLLNAIGALIWAAAGAGGGYLFGHALERALGEMKQYSLILVGGLLVLGGLVVLGRRLWRRRQAGSAASAASAKPDKPADA
jgi:membrane protein DedA with SNARE-associated domain